MTDLPVRRPRELTAGSVLRAVTAYAAAGLLLAWLAVVALRMVALDPDQLDGTTIALAVAAPLTAALVAVGAEAWMRYRGREAGPRTAPLVLVPAVAATTWICVDTALADTLTGPGDSTGRVLAVAGLFLPWIPVWFVVLVLAGWLLQRRA